MKPQQEIALQLLVTETTVKISVGVAAIHRCVRFRGTVAGSPKNSPADTPAGAPLAHLFAALKLRQRPGVPQTERA